MAVVGGGEIAPPPGPSAEAASPAGPPRVTSPAPQVDAPKQEAPLPTLPLAPLKRSFHGDLRRVDPVL